MESLRHRAFRCVAFECEEVRKEGAQNFRAEFSVVDASEHRPLPDADALGSACLVCLSSPKDIQCLLQTFFSHPNGIFLYSRAS